MGNIYLVYGDEPQLMEQKKEEILFQYKECPLVSYTEESSVNAISEALMEDSLFNEKKLILLIDIPIIKKGKKAEVSDSDGESTARVKKEKKEADARFGSWQQVYDILLSYSKDNPVLILWHSSIDKRIKSNMDLLKKTEAFGFTKLTPQEVHDWIRQYIVEQGYNMEQTAALYLSDLLELWQDVPVGFLKTEFDRLFLLLGDERAITADFLVNNMGDFGAKNIFLFKEALFQKKADMLMELLPFVLQPKEQDRAMAYIEKQLRLQFMVTECRLAGMTENDIYDFLNENGFKTKSYPIKLAYKEGKNISPESLAFLLRGMYDLTHKARLGEGDMERFKDLCLRYCKR